jgi:hypothetical protein
VEKVREHEERQALEEKARQETEAQERAVREFELTQAGISVKGGRVGSGRTDTLRREGSQQLPTAPAATPEVESAGKRGEKRKFSFNEDEVARIAEEERAKARKAIDDERVGSSPSNSARTIANMVHSPQNLPFRPSGLRPSFLHPTKAIPCMTSKRSPKRNPSAPPRHKTNPTTTLFTPS